MIRLYFVFLIFFLSTTAVFAQMNFSRYLDEGSVPIFDIDQHLDVKFAWKMEGKVQMHMNEGLNFIEESNFDLALSNLDETIKIDSLFWPAHYYRAVVLTKRRQYKEARKAFQRVIRISPKQAEAYVELGRIHERVKNYKEAKTYYEQAVNADPKLAAAHFGVASVELFRGEPRKAIRLYERCIEVDSAFAEAYVVLSIIKFRDKKKNNESFQLLNAALKANPKYTHTYFWRGYFHVLLGATENCLADWTSYINLNPGNSFMLTMRGFLFIELNRFDDAFADLRKAFLSRTIDEEAFKGAQTLLDKQIDLHAATQYLLRTGYGLKEETFSLVKKSYCLLLAGRGRDAVQELQKAKLLEPSATVFLLEGIAFEHVNNHPYAYNAYENALKLDNDIFDAHKKRCIYRMELANWAGVDEDIREMMRLMPESIIAYRLSGFSKGHRRDFAGCVIDLTKYLERDSTDAEALRSRSVCRVGTGDLKGANEDLRRILDIEPANWALHEDVAKNYLDLKDTSNAIVIFERFAEGRPNIFIPHLELARIHVAQESWSAARQRVDTLLTLLNNERLNTQRSETLYLQSEIEFANGAFETVVNVCSDALKLNKNNNDARYLRAKAYYKSGDIKRALSDLKTLNERGFQNARPLYDKLSASR